MLCAINHIVNASNKKKIDSEIKDHYTTEEAAEAISEITGSDVTFSAEDAGIPSVKIKNSYKVKSRYKRQKASAIIANTDVTSREFDNISSEWLAHNLAEPISLFTESAADVDLDYVKDPRWYVRAISKGLEVLGWE